VNKKNKRVSKKE